jgi:hypothetical protein
MHKSCKMHCKCNTVQDYIAPIRYIKKAESGIEEVTERTCRFCGRDATPFGDMSELIIQYNNGGSLKCDEGYNKKRTFDFKSYETMDGIDFDELYFRFEDKCYKTFDEEVAEDIVQSVFDLSGDGYTSLKTVAHKSIEIIYQLMSEFGSLKTGQCPVRSIIKTLAKEHPLELDEIEDTNEPIKVQYHTPTGFIVKYQGDIFKNRYIIPFEEVIVNIWYLCARMLNKYNERKAANRKRIEHQNFEVINVCKGSNSRQGIGKNLKEKRKYRPKRLIKEVYKLRKNKKLRKQRRMKELEEIKRIAKERFKLLFLSLISSKIQYSIFLCTYHTFYQVIWKQIKERRQSTINGSDSLAFSF